MSSPPLPLDRHAVLKHALREIQQLRARVDTSERREREPIAVLGMACRLPGGVTSPEALWRLLEDGIDATREIPSDRWDVDAFYDPDPGAPGKMYVRRGGFLDEVDRFDAAFFGIHPREAAYIDPQHRLFWEVAWEALERAGTSPHALSGSRTGVYLGITSSDYSMLQALSLDLSELDGYAALGSASNFAPGRLSYMLGLQGPSVAVDTACSSSAVATHLACKALLSGEIDLAIVGGVNLVLSPGGNIVLSKARMLSPDGRSKAFDASADGYGRGEGCGALVLSRLGDALARRAPVLATILGSAVNQDGPSSGLTVPSGAAQQTLVREALSRAGVIPAEVGYVEAHGTGTPLGDPIELRALGAVLSEGRPAGHPLLVGSIKSNIGHLEAAAGVAGLLKAVLCLQHRRIPPHLHFRDPNPNAPWAEIQAEIPTRSMPWATGGRRVAGVSSFGASGTNAHLVLGDAPAPATSPLQDEHVCHLLTLSARREPALRALAARYEAYLAENPSVSLGDVAFTTRTGRAHFPHRLALVASSASEARERLASFLASTPGPGLSSARARTDRRPRIAFLFSGQGAQYPGMARALHATQPVFREAVDRCAALLDPHLERPITEVLFPPEGAPAAPGALDQTAVTQPALFTIAYALTTLWRSLGVEPEAVLGHSVGEIAAACCAGALSLEDAAPFIAARGRLMQSLPGGGAMAAVFAAPEQIADVLAPRATEIAIAALNGPTETVLSGAAGPLDELLEVLSASGITSRRLHTSHAFHAPLMDPILDDLERAAACTRAVTPRIPWISNLTGDLVTSPVDAAYWRRHARAPVRFAEGLQRLHALGIDAFVEVGPRPTLLGLARRCLPESTGVLLPSLRDGRDDLRTLLGSLAELYTLGARLDGTRLDHGPTQRLVSLPTYPFQGERHWIPAATPRHAAPAPQRVTAAGLAADATHTHPLLGRRVPSPSVIAFETQLDPAALAALRDHRVHGRIVVSGVLHLSMAMASMAEIQTATGDLRVEQITFLEPLLLQEGEVRTAQLILEPDTAGHAMRFQLFSLDPDGTDTGAWTLHTTALLSASPPGALERAGEGAPLDAIQARCGEALSGDDFYARYWKTGEHEIGPSFRLVRRLWRRDGEALAELEAPEPPALTSNDIRQVAHLLTEACVAEACGQVVKAALPLDATSTVTIGVGVDRHHQRGATAGKKRYCHVQLRSSLEADPLIIADMRLLDETGQVIAVSEGMRLAPVRADTIRRAATRHRDRPRPEVDRALKELHAAPSPAERRDALERYLRAQIAALSELSPDAIDADAPLRDVGLDSLQAADLRASLARDLGADIPAVDLLQGPSLGDLVARLATSLLGETPPARSAASVTSPPAHTTTASRDDTARWIRRPTPRPEARIRLLCFPLGGAGAFMYRSWASALPTSVELCSVQLPGREDRLNDPPVDSLSDLLDALVEIMPPLLDRPYAVFGSSMGGLLGFELVRRLRATHGKSPLHLFVAASPAPQRFRRIIDERFSSPDLGFLRRFDMIPDAVAEDPSLLAAVLPALQADFQLVRGHLHRDEIPLDIPISAYGGKEDALVLPEDLVAWSEHTRGDFQLRMFAGGHQFMKTDTPSVLQAIRRDLSIHSQL
ncbi:type I polyketide synthase [Chondromyces crocatus]|uniref:Polyketide synthase n=1 Tax=Chondromyces crocatus TaxID=52 RepID=B1GYG2_CHOCO|nr:type I polyketide synthase [Chondromyces crocatus]AKT41316.1 uncharacterized protein CMC5_054900 [Chondromyces crocatus]CAQ18835.1 polyketide synthase [Chondromyces crocatus]